MRGHWTVVRKEEGVIHEKAWGWMVAREQSRWTVRGIASVDSAATEAALDRLLANGVVRDILRADGAGMKHLATRWERGWRKRNDEWEFKVRFVGREYKWQKFCQDLFVLGASCCIGRIVHILSLKRGAPTFTLDCTDACH